MFLSVYVVLVTCVTICSQTVDEERGEGLTWLNLALLDLKKREKMQGTLGLFTALNSMYLFSALGVQGEPDPVVYWLGFAGFVTLR